MQGKKHRYVVAIIVEHAEHIHSYVGWSLIWIVSYQCAVCLCAHITVVRVT